MFAIVWAGSAASADVVNRSPAPVKYYIVPPAGHGPVDLYRIAAQTLGNSSRFMQIFRLNKGRLQPNGRRLENPRIIEPGWVLELPSAATGPGVHFGLLPQATPSASAAPPSRSSARVGTGFSLAAVVVIACLALLTGSAIAVVGARLVVPRLERRRQVSGPAPKHQGRRFRSVRRTPEVPSEPAAADPADWSWLSSTARPADLAADHPSPPQQPADFRGQRQ